mmetsp:Transcript_2220/g.5917  ORF Transcript_2220/g.5917 Transcript_2220/m.5917 type:complete len:258 (+) Transcript_2220:292-1065(+)
MILVDHFVGNLGNTVPNTNKPPNSHEDQQPHQGLNAIIRQRMKHDFQRQTDRDNDVVQEEKELPKEHAGPQCNHFDIQLHHERRQNSYRKPKENVLGRVHIAPLMGIAPRGALGVGFQSGFAKLLMVPSVSFPLHHPSPGNLPAHRDWTAANRVAFDNNAGRILRQQKHLHEQNQHVEEQQQHQRGLHPRRVQELERTLPPVVVAVDFLDVQLLAEVGGHPEVYLALGNLPPRVPLGRPPRIPRFDGILLAEGVAHG